MEEEEEEERERERSGKEGFRRQEIFNLEAENLRNQSQNY